MRAVFIGVAAALLAASAGAQPRPRPGARLPEADAPTPPIRHKCSVEVGGLVRIDGKLAAWRDDYCGPLTLATRPWRCEENRELKLRRLTWSPWFWVYVRVSRQSPTVDRYCPQGMRSEPGAQALSWSAAAAREDDFLLGSNRRAAASLD